MPSFLENCGSRPLDAASDFERIVDHNMLVVYRTQAGGLGHGPVLHEHQVVVIHGNYFAGPVPQTMDAADDEQPAFVFMVGIRLEERG